ncbi:MAG: response regulator [Candidatus Poribacteria bacterium]
MLFTTWDETGGAADVRPSRTVLVVDDDKETLDVLCQVLRRDGYRCIPASDGAQAVEAFASAPEIAVAMIDFDLPDVTGVQLIHEFKRVRPHVPLLLMTGNPSQRVIFEACDAGACTYLRKPIDLQHLRQLLARTLEARGETREETRGPGGLGGRSITMTMSNMGMKRTSVFVRWSRWIVRRK